MVYTGGEHRTLHLIKHGRDHESKTDVPPTGAVDILGGTSYFYPVGPGQFHTVGAWSTIDFDHRPFETFDTFINISLRNEISTSVPGGFSPDAAAATRAQLQFVFDIERHSIFKLQAFQFLVDSAGTSR